MLKRINKKGQMLDLVSGTVVGLMVFIFVVFAVLYGIAVLNPSSFFARGTTSSQNLSSDSMINLQNNLTSGVSQFGSYIPTTLIVLGVVLVLSAIAILIMYVRRMQGGGTSGTL